MQLNPRPNYQKQEFYIVDISYGKHILKMTNLQKFSKTYVKKKVNNSTYFILLMLQYFLEITFWGGNLTTIDMVLKPEYVEEIRQLLSQEHIKYQVLFQDLQKAIDEENPPISEETSDRHGNKKLITFIFLVF